MQRGRGEKSLPEPREHIGGSGANLAPARIPRRQRNEETSVVVYSSQDVRLEDNARNGREAGPARNQETRVVKYSSQDVRSEYSVSRGQRELRPARNEETSVMVYSSQDGRSEDSSHNTLELRPAHNSRLQVDSTRHQPRQQQSRQLSKLQARSQPTGYRGEPSVRMNQSLNNLPDEENCSFWIEGLPPTITISELLGAIRDFGRIFTSNISNSQCQPRGPLPTAGAKLVFFDGEDVRRFRGHAVRDRALRVKGKLAKVIPNMIKVRHQNLARHFSRVVIVEGPRTMVNAWFLSRRIRRAGFFFDTDLVLEDRAGLAHDEGRIEWRFAAWRCQAQDAVYFLVHDDEFRGRVRVRYGHDPCAFPEGRMPSFQNPVETEATVPRHGWTWMDRVKKR